MQARVIFYGVDGNRLEQAGAMMQTDGRRMGREGYSGQRHPPRIYDHGNEALFANPELDAWVKARTPARRWGRPEELAGTVIYFASAASDYVNGQIVYADGGMISVL